MPRQDTLRPVERRVLALVDDGVDDVEIARRFRRSPEMIGRLVTMAQLPRPHAPSSTGHRTLRPLERCVLRWRDGGAGYDEIAPRFRRSPRFLEQVETLANYKLDQAQAS